MMKTGETGTLLYVQEPATQETEKARAREKPIGADQRLPEVAYVVLGYVRAYPEGVHGYHLGRILSRFPLRSASLGLGHLYRILHQLESAGLVKSEVEDGSPRLRYRLTITLRGEACFSSWLTTVPEGSEATCDQVLDRLRFADRLPGKVVLRLVDEAERECKSKLEELAQHTASEHPPKGEESHVSRPYTMALMARVAADLRWLEEVRQMVLGGSAGQRSTEPLKQRPLPSQSAHNGVGLTEI